MQFNCINRRRSYFWLRSDIKIKNRVPPLSSRPLGYVYLRSRWAREGTDSTYGDEQPSVETLPPTASLALHPATVTVGQAGAGLNTVHRVQTGSTNGVQPECRSDLDFPLRPMGCKMS